MSYTPTNWKAGDTITAEKLNNMEAGIKASDIYGDMFIVHATMDQQTSTLTVEETPAEIQAAATAEQMFKVIITNAGIEMEQTDVSPESIGFQTCEFMEATENALVFLLIMANLVVETGVLTLTRQDMFSVAATPMQG